MDGTPRADQHAARAPRRLTRVRRAHRVNSRVGDRPVSRGRGAARRLSRQPVDARTRARRGQQEDFDANRFYPKTHSVELARLATRTAIARETFTLKKSSAFCTRVHTLEARHLIMAEPVMAEPALGKKRAEPFGQRASAHVHVHAHTLSQPRRASIAPEHDRSCAPGGRQC